MMPEQRLDILRGGIDAERTPSANRGGWSQSNLIRWRSGVAGQAVPEKQRGWVLYAPTKLVTDGSVCRGLFWWTDLNSLSWLAAGTNTQIKIVRSGIVNDITPTDASYVPGTVSSPPNPLYSLRIVSLDAFGQVLIVCPSGLPLYTWTPPVIAPAAPITTGPQHNQGAFVATPQQQVIAFGSSPDGGGQDPLLVRFSDVSDYTSWEPTTTNQAGSFRLSRGNRIVAGIYTPGGIFLWTDDDLWSMQYLGFPLVYGFYMIGAGAGCIAQKAICTLGSVIYWMSDHGFFMLSGSGVQQIPCPVWDKVYLDLDLDNFDKVVAAANYHFNEIIWWYPSASGSTGEISAYVRLNIENGCWDYGSSEQFNRTAWTDLNKPGGPLGACLGPYIHQHDTGLNADIDPVTEEPATVPITGVMVRSGFQDIQEGGQAVFADRLIPDFLWTDSGSGAEITLSLLFRQYPDDPATVVGPLTITPATKFVSLANYDPVSGKLVRPRGREWAVEIDCSALDTWFRWGAPRLRVMPDGMGP